MRNTAIRQILSVIVLVIGNCPNASAQKIWEDRTGYIRAQANLAPGFMIKEKTTMAYIDADMDFFPENQFSYTGSVCYSFNTIRADKPGLIMNHSLFWGGSYHFLKPGRLDAYVNICPGMGVVQARYAKGEGLKETPVAYVPLISASAGCNYYVGSIFHFFLKVQGVSGHVTSTMPSPLALEEVKAMVGLGWNLRVHN